MVIPKVVLLSKFYTIEQRDNLNDLVNFYADWLYGPVDEEMENKMYFLDFNSGNKGNTGNTGVNKKEKRFEDYFYNTLKDDIDLVELNQKKKLNTFYGLKINDNKL